MALSNFLSKLNWRLMLVVFSLLILWRVFKIGIAPWTLLGYIFRAPGFFFKGTIWYFIINGSVLLAIGLALFFWKRIIKFIDERKAVPVATV